MEFLYYPISLAMHMASGMRGREEGFPNDIILYRERRARARLSLLIHCKGIKS
jgi:hypothetical protein